MLLFAVKALSQRTLIALMGLETLILASSVFVLAYMISSNPTVTQLVEQGLYSAFVLAVILYRRR